jgi:quinol monooxygenase YgiN
MAQMISTLSFAAMASEVPRSYSGRRRILDVNPGVIAMIKLALFARLQAKPGKEAEVEKFLQAGLAMARDERSTPIWFALRLSPSTFGVFDAFHDEQGRQSHLSGPIAQALMAQAPELFAAPPAIEPIEVLGLKNDGSA